MNRPEYIEMINLAFDFNIKGNWNLVLTGIPKFVLVAGYKEGIFF